MRLNNAEWKAEYAHPHKWSDRDMDNCLYRLEKSWFSVRQVTDAVSENLDDIIKLMSDCEHPRSFVDVATDYIADTIAQEKLYTQNFPESAVFSINNH